MCGRFVLNTTQEDLKQMYKIFDQNIYEKSFANFNIAPSNLHPVIIKNPLTETTEVITMQWRLIPDWAKEATSAYNIINARFETLYQRTTFKEAFISRRCLIPASGFYEWDRRVNPKQPFYICGNDNKAFSFGGLWNKMTIPETNRVIYSFAIITAPANEMIKEVHDRMPLIIQSENYDLWLKSQSLNMDEELSIIKSSNEFKMFKQKISKEVNSPTNNHRGLIEVI